MIFFILLNISAQLVNQAEYEHRAVHRAAGIGSLPSSQPELQVLPILRRHVGLIVYQC